MKTKNVFIILGICLIVGFIAAALTTNFIGEPPIQYEKGGEDHSFIYNQDLKTISTEDWSTIINQKTIDDATTNCYGHTFENGKHTLYCDRVAGSDTELDFKTYFKTDVKDYAITEIKTISTPYESKEIIGLSITDCPKDSLNKTCYAPTYKISTAYTYETIKTPLSTLKNINDWSLTSKRDFVKNEKRVYKIEWKDEGPSIIRKVIQGTKDIGKIVLPQIQYFINELKINPQINYTSTLNNWGGTASNTELDEDGNITAEATINPTTYPDYLQDLTQTNFMVYMNSTTPLNLGTQANPSNVGASATTGVTSENDRGALEFDGATDRMELGNSVFANGFKSAGTLQFWIYPQAGLEVDANGFNKIFDIDGRLAILGNCTHASCTAGADKAYLYWYDGASSHYEDFTLTYDEWSLLTTKWNATGIYLYDDGVPLIEHAGDTPIDIRLNNPAVVGDSKDQVGQACFGMKMQELYVGEYEITQQEIDDSQAIAGSTTYATSGNRTLDGYCPNYPDQYQWRNASITQVDNDASNYAGMTVLFSNDNSTWTNDLAYNDVDNEQYACVMLIPNVTTDASTTPRISEVSIDYYSVISPTLNLEHPLNTTYYVDPVPINVSVYDADGIDSLYYAIDDGINTSINYPNNATESLSQGGYKIQVYVNDTSGMENTTTQYFYVNTPPTIPIPISPANESFHTSLPALNVNESYDVDTLEYYFEVDDSPAFDSVDEGSGFIAATPTTISWTPTTLSEGGYYWRALSNDGATNSSWSNVSYFTYDNTAPVVEEAYNLTDMATYVLPVVSEWNFTSSDTNQDKCYYNTTDNGTLTYVDCNGASYYTTSWATGGLKTVRYCSNDSAGLETCRTADLKVYSISDSQHASHTSIGEGDTVTFTLYVNLTGIVSEWTKSTANLTINGTEYTTNRYDDTNFMRFTKELTVPGTWGNSTGHPYNWSFHYEIKNSTDSLQTKAMDNDTLTVYEIAVDDCSVYSTRIINYTLYDEETKTNTNLANQSIETDITLGYGSTTIYEYSTSTALNNSLEICISNDVLNFTAYTLGAVTRYSADDHVVEFHYFDDYALSNTTMQTVNLYDLWSTTARDEYSTSFLINYQDENYLPVEGAIIDLLRYYVGDGIYLSVENARTDADGNTRLHFVTEDVKYRAIVRVDNEIVYTTPEFLALCQSTPCQINLQKESDITPVGDYEHTDNLQYSIVLDTDTREVTLTYATQNGVSADMELNVTKWDSYFNDTLCSETQSSSGGTLTCTVPGTYTNMTYFVDVYKDGEFVAQRFFDLNPNPQDTFGNTGLILAGIIYITCVLLAISGGGVPVLIFAALGVILASSLALFNGGGVLGVGSAIMWFIVALIVMLVKIAKRRGS